MVKSMVLQKLKKMQQELGEQASLVRQAQSDVVARIEQLSQERALLLAQPITREDYADLVCADIDRIADGYQRKAAERMRSQMRPGERYGAPVIVETALRLPKADSASLFGNLRDDSEYDFNKEPLSQGVATFLFRDEMKRAARAAVAVIVPWPYSDARPMAESIARVEAIDAELQVLGEERAGIAELLDQVGVEAGAGDDEGPALPLPPMPGAEVDPRSTRAQPPRTDVVVKDGAVVVPQDKR